MRLPVVFACLILLLVLASIAWAAIDLTVDKAPTPPGVELSWTSDEQSPFEIYRSSDPARPYGPDIRLGQTTATFWDDPPPPDPLNTYRVYSCSSCHPDQHTVTNTNMSGEHSLHVSREGYRCGECHAATVNVASSILDTFVHLSGTPEVMFLEVGMSWDPTGNRCSGFCHGQNHRLDPW